MKVLVIGNGGREHALAWKLLQSSKIDQVFCIPGNGGTATLKGCTNLSLSVDDFEGISRVALVNNTALVVVGPEVPLALGITDYLQKHNLTVFGPNRAGAQIEASKAWAKGLMQAAGIPTAKAAVFTEIGPARDYVQHQGAPIVIKADGLAAGKGVTVAMTVEEALAAVEAIFGGQFGQAGDRIVIEDYMVGQEVSILALTDGLTIRPLLPAQDHKRIGEGDRGANTGGMGAYAPAPILTPALMERVQQEILEPAIATLRQQGIDYRGVLYAGLMITPAGDPQVVEFNCRFGDPETQVVLPLLETPLDELLMACAQQRLEAQPPIQWKSGAAACVVVAAGGYPESYRKGQVVHGLNQIDDPETVVFHAGTQLKRSEILTDAGRVLGVTATGETFDAAIARAYAGVEQLKFEDMYYRRDIGHLVRTPDSMPS